MKFNENDYWCYTDDIINTVIYENKINDILFSLADDKSININIKTEEPDTTISDFLYKRIHFFNN